MKKLLLLSVIGSSLLIGSNPAKADWDVWTIKESALSLMVHTSQSAFAGFDPISNEDPITDNKSNFFMRLIYLLLLS